MLAPTPELRASTSSTVAPPVISAWACVSWVLSLPWALSMVNWEEARPAFWNAWVRSGASNETYRADEAVSGRRTPMLPLPDAASPVSWDIAEKSLVNEVAVSDGAADGVALCPAPVPVVVFFAHAVRAVRARARIIATDRIVRRLASSLMCSPSLVCGPWLLRCSVHLEAGLRRDYGARGPAAPPMQATAGAGGWGPRPPRRDIRPHTT